MAFAETRPFEFNPYNDGFHGAGTPSMDFAAVDDIVSNDYNIYGSFLDANIGYGAPTAASATTGNTINGLMIDGDYQIPKKKRALTKDQRQHANVMRILQACDECRKRKVKESFWVLVLQWFDN